MQGNRHRQGQVEASGLVDINGNSAKMWNSPLTINCLALRQVAVVLACQESIAITSDDALNVASESSVICSNTTTRAPTHC